MALATSIALPVVRHPVVVAKALSSLAAMTGSRVIGGLGPGSSQADYDAVGVPFTERWARFDESMAVVRTLVRGEATTGGTYYGPAGPLAPVREPPPEVWFGSWGSDRRLASMAAVADGWFASAYNATPAEFAAARARLDGHLTAADATRRRSRTRSPRRGPSSRTSPASATGRCTTCSARCWVATPSLDNLPIGSQAQCAEALAAYAEAGAGADPGLAAARRPGPARAAGRRGSAVVAGCPFPQFAACVVGQSEVHWGQPRRCGALVPRPSCGPGVPRSPGPLPFFWAALPAVLRGGLTLASPVRGMR